jgi:hypothetical protein
MSIRIPTRDASLNPGRMKAWQKWLRLGPALGLLIASVIFGAWWKRGAERAECRSGLRSYNNGIASCGMADGAYQAWKNPEATEKLVLKLFDRQIPRCPAGGKLTLVYGRLPYPGLPHLVCSLEGSHGHVDPHPNP